MNNKWNKESPDNLLLTKAIKREEMSQADFEKLWQDRLDIAIRRMEDKNGKPWKPPKKDYIETQQARLAAREAGYSVSRSCRV